MFFNNRNRGSLNNNQPIIQLNKSPGRFDPAFFCIRPKKGIARGTYSTAGVVPTNHWRKTIAQSSKPIANFYVNKRKNRLTVMISGLSQNAPKEIHFEFIYKTPQTKLSFVREPIRSNDESYPRFA